MSAGLRIIAGLAGGRFIEAPRGRGTRPTAERVREAWFSALGDVVRGARVLDLFAGSGALGIEALSRGAEHAHFVEADRGAVAVLKRNLAALEFAPRATVVRADAFRWLTTLGDARWDVALADPPYGSRAAGRLVRRFLNRPFADALWIEHRAEEELPPGADWTRRYGDTRLSRFGAAAADASGERRYAEEAG